MGHPTNIVFDKMDPEFLRRLDGLREACDPITFNITSSYRSPDYNESIGGATHSKHMEGIAVDITMHNGKDRLTVVDLAIARGFTVGVGKTFLHLDTRQEQVLFGY